MIQLNAKNITKTYGIDTILEDISFTVEYGDKVGIVGINGAGKSTLLKIITGENTATSGEIFIRPEATVGYLKQSDDFQSHNTVMMEMLSVFEHLQNMEIQIEKLSEQIASKPDEKLIDKLDELYEAYNINGGYTYKSDIRGMLTHMNFDENYYDKIIDTLSGGERTRLALAGILLKKPDLLILDEPTNHLDIETLNWLEKYLQGYKGTLLVVSHDRYFLDKCTNRIFEIEHHKINTYEGNYSFYAQERKTRIASALKQYESQKEEIARQEALILRYKQRGTEKLAKRAASREKKLEKIELMDKPVVDNNKMHIRFKESYKSGTDVLALQNVEKTFFEDNKFVKLFENINADIKRNDKICIVGANGIGKSTLLKMIVGERPITAGKIKFGHNVKMAYYDQKQALLNENATLLDEIHSEYNLYSETEIRSLLGRFLFRGDDIFKKVGELSGGEKARLSLLKIMMSGANLLMLDEPTNHLDIDAKEMFEDAIAEFEGTVLIVSHDRYLLSKVPDKILELTPVGVVTYLGQYDYYLEKKEQFQGNTSGKREEVKNNIDNNKTEGTNSTNIPLTSNEERMLKKEQEAIKRRKAREKAKLEEDIAMLESKVETIEQEMCNEEIVTDYEKMNQLNEQLVETKTLLDEKFETWIEYE